MIVQPKLQLCLNNLLGKGAVVLQRVPAAAVRQPGDDADVVAGRHHAVGQPEESQAQGEQGLAQHSSTSFILSPVC